MNQKSFCVFAVMMLLACGNPMETDNLPATDPPPYDPVIVVQSPPCSCPCSDATCTCNVEPCTCPQPVDPCDGVTCEGVQVCKSGQCQDPTCVDITCPHGQVCDPDTLKCVGRAGEQCVVDATGGEWCEGSTSCCPGPDGTNLCVPIQCDWKCEVRARLVLSGRSSRCEEEPPPPVCNWVCVGAC